MFNLFSIRITLNSIQSFSTFHHQIPNHSKHLKYIHHNRGMHKFHQTDHLTGISHVLIPTLIMHVTLPNVDAMIIFSIHNTNLKNLNISKRRDASLSR